MKTKKLTKEDIIEWATKQGWVLDKYRNLQKEVGDREYRLKLSKNSVRYEVKVHHSGDTYSKPSSEWIRLRSAYYKDLSITEDGKLGGMKK